MKTLTLIALLFFGYEIVQSQIVKPCDSWETGFLQTDPKMEDGSSIAEYIATRLQADTALLRASTCMVGLSISLNCKGEFSYEKQDYKNKTSLSAQCAELLQKTENIVDAIKTLKPGKIGNQNKDFVFKLVVKVKNNGIAAAEILY